MSVKCTYLLHLLLVPFFEARDVVRPFLRFLNLFPRFHFFLLQKRDTVGQQLGITVNAKKRS
jgi:hypothetical protein